MRVEQKWNSRRRVEQREIFVMAPSIWEILKLDPEIQAPVETREPSENEEDLPRERAAMRPVPREVRVDKRQVPFPIWKDE